METKFAINDIRVLLKIKLKGMLDNNKHKQIKKKTVYQRFLFIIPPVKTIISWRLNY